MSRTSQFTTRKMSQASALETKKNEVLTYLSRLEIKIEGLPIRMNDLKVVYEHVADLRKIVSEVNSNQSAPTETLNNRFENIRQVVQEKKSDTNKEESKVRESGMKLMDDCVATLQRMATEDANKNKTDVSELMNKGLDTIQQIIQDKKIEPQLPPSKEDLMKQGLEAISEILKEHSSKKNESQPEDAVLTTTEVQEVREFLRHVRTQSNQRPPMFTEAESADLRQMIRQHRQREEARSRYPIGSGGPDRKYV